MTAKNVGRRKIVSVIGNRKIEKDGIRYKIAFELGKALVDNGYRVQSGGLRGVMEAVLAGARSSEHYHEGDTIALVPSFDTETANEYADIVIPTGLDVMRNALVANAYAVIGVGGGAGIWRFMMMKPISSSTVISLVYPSGTSVSSTV